MRVLIIAVNTQLYAIPMEHVRQVLRKPDVTPVPLSPPALLGVINVRGEVLPVLDTGVITGSGALNSCAFAVLVTTDKETMALAAQSMPTAADFDQPVAAANRPGELGVFTSGGHMVVLLSVEGLAASQLDTTRAS